MSLFKSFINLRDQVGDLYARNVDFMDRLINPQTGLSDVIPVTTDLSARWSNSMLTFLDAQGSVIKSVDPNIVNGLKSEIGSTGLTVQQALDNLGAGTDDYGFMCDMITKFSYSSRVSYSDVCNYLNNYQNADVKTIRESLFTAVDQQGYISRPSFITILKHWVDKGKKAADDGTLQVDTTNPYSLAAIVNIAVGAIITAFSAICTVLAITFQGLWVMLSVIFNLLSTIIGKIQEDASVVYDPLAGTTYVNGPILSATSFPDTIVETNNDDHVWLHEYNGIATFIWREDNSTFKGNQYFFPYWKPRETVSWLVLNNVISNSTNNLIINNPKWFRKMYSRQEFSNTLVYNDDEQPASQNEMLASLAVGFIMQTLTVDAMRRVNDTGYTYSGNMGYWGQTPSATADKAEKLTAWCGQVVNRLIQYPNTNYDDMDDTLVLTNVANALANYISKWVMPYRNRPMGIVTNVNDLTVISSNFPILHAPCVADDRIYDIYNWVDNIMKLDMTISVVTEADCLPSDFGIKLPAFDIAIINNIIIATALVTTATFIVSTKVKKAMIKRSASKKALRSDEVTKKREAYLADPTNRTKRKEFEDAYYKFDKYGQWFGWGSYDAANGWVDAPTTDSNALYSTLGSIKASVGRDELASSIESLTLQIRNLIRYIE